MHHSTDDDSELEVRPMPVQQRDDSASSSDSRPLHDPDSASAVSSHTISITVSHGSSDHHLHVPHHATFEIAKAISAVLSVSGEVDELSDRVGALEAAVDGGTIVAVKEFDMAAELLMRQLLKLDGIKADGEARAQRKAEVRRIQKLQEDVDTLKARCYRAKPQL
ncbi:hypothetical protein DY000_02026507 [Brassica cretica]|uniref:BAG domain-containing protein n=1 Tax=Brassica cretica TaxID=69181 RepID=A0ABQ7E8U3_BRACR|nr:hypothetical protein DY000_02026507 [Brassica cretica]